MENIKILKFFSKLTHNFEQTNGIQSEFFYRSSMLEVLQQMEGLSRHKHH